MRARQDDRVYLCTDGGTVPESEQGKRHVYFSIRLSDDIVAASTVLDGICAAPGMAKLPSVVSEDDFLLWRKHSPASPPPLIEDLASILRV